MTTDTRTVAARYRLESVIGSGGVGVVWRAEDTVLGRSVAVKEIVLPPSVPTTERETLRERALREARAAARLDHPGVVKVYDVCEEDGRAFVIMALVEGRTLAETVREDGPLPAAEVARIGVSLLDTLNEAHRIGILHRDVKPGNVLLGEDGAVCLTDFGIASEEGDSTLTGTGVLIGSPSYIAPERARGEEPGPQSDLWSLGATLFTAAEGRPPFDKGNPVATVTAVVNDEPEPFQLAGPLEPVLSKMLDKDPAQRPDPTELRRMLLSVQNGYPGSADAATAAMPYPNEPTTTTRLVSDRTAALPYPVARRRPAPLLLLLVGVVLLAAVIAAIATRTSAGRHVFHIHHGSSVKHETTAPSQVPADWTPWTAPQQGFHVSYPAGFSESATHSPDGQYAQQFTGSPGAFEVYAQRQNPGPSPLAHWQEVAKSYASSRPGYHQIGITQVSWNGLEAADLEYTFTSNGTTVHEIDREVFVSPDRAYVISVAAPDSQWGTMSKLWPDFLASFKAL